MHHRQNRARHAEGTGALQGFDAEFTNIIDYIPRITYRIWEETQPDLCHRYYSADCPVHTLAGHMQGAAEHT